LSSKKLIIKKVKCKAKKGYRRKPFLFVPLLDASSVMPISSKVSFAIADRE
jgi:hypothetical protein